MDTKFMIKCLNINTSNLQAVCFYSAHRRMQKWSLDLDLRSPANDGPLHFELEIRMIL